MLTNLEFFFDFFQTSRKTHLLFLAYPDLKKTFFRDRITKTTRNPRKYQVLMSSVAKLNLTTQA